MSDNSLQNSESANNSMVPTDSRMLTKAEFQDLGDMPDVLEWFANISNKLTRQAYRKDIEQFSKLIGIESHEDFRMVRRSHVILWRDLLQNDGLGAATIRRKLSALSSLFDHLCNRNSVETNPVAGVKRPAMGANVGKTPSLSRQQAKKLFNAPPSDTVRGLRDRALLATLLLHGSRVTETVNLKLKDIHEREGVKHFKFFGKRQKTRFVPVNPIALKRIEDYLFAVERLEAMESYIFQSSRKGEEGKGKPLTRMTVYNLVMKWGLKVGISEQSLQPHAMRATAATLALKNDAELASVQEWLGHSDISTTRLYDRRAFDVEDSPSYKVVL